MTNMEAFAAYASVVESNPRYMELIEKQDNKTITDDDTLQKYDVFFNPFMFKNFMDMEDDYDPEEDKWIKAKVQDMIDRGVIGYTR